MNKKQDIIQAAERLFYLNGFHATSTDNICREAGVSTRTLYRYFPSREALTAAIMNERRERFFSALCPPEEPESISHLFNVMGKWMNDYGIKGCFFLKVWSEYAEKEPMLAEQAMAYRHAMRAYIATCISHSCGRENPPLADAIWTLFEGTLTTALVMGAPEACERGKMVSLQLIHSFSGCP
ncbi:TetR/AcrR family transcriptional regulator [Mixta sp. Marseille-Q2659]|uniref:TetR/AcrR family transcriptional regulator n=1 Tax=Mixta sp. Marseille-Q2659 TaxID=2736607 RepID=UPI0023B915F8|nr:TetR/AcrR family transcriptional regulator [Mixta sp. Marseille-Q2659]